MMFSRKSISEAWLSALRSLKNIPEQYFVNAAIITILVPLLMMFSGCAYYRVTSRDIGKCKSDNLLSELLLKYYPELYYPRSEYPEQNLAIMLFREHHIYAVDSTGKWLLENPALKHDTLICKSTFEPKPADSVITAENRKHNRYYPKTESDIIQRINLHVRTINSNDSGMVYIPLSSIYQYDIYHRNVLKTCYGPALILLGTALLVAVIVGVTRANNMSIYD